VALVEPFGFADLAPGPRHPIGCGVTSA